MKPYTTGICAVSCLLLTAGLAVAFEQPEPADQPAETEPATEPAPQGQPDRPERRIPPEILQRLIDEQRQLQQNRNQPARPEVPQTPMPEPFEPGMNLLADPGFEGFDRWDEGQPWWNSFKVQNSKAWVEFDIAEGEGRTGERAAHLHMDSTTQPGRVRVHGVVQELVPETLPRYVSGWYRVENWERGTEKQYLQTVVICRGPDNVPARIPRNPRGLQSVQLAMTLAGVSEPPLRMGNREFEVTGPVDPVEGEWVFFEFDLHELFQKHWGVVPVNSAGTRVFFEVRYDQKNDMTPARCDVYYDDVYVGDESRAPASSDADDSGGAEAEVETEVEG